MSSKIRSVRVGALAVLAASIALCAQSAERAPPVRPSLAITHVGVISMLDERVAPDQTILIAGDRIVALGPHLRVPHAAKVIDGRGRFAIPGLWDMHVHVLSETADPAGAKAMLATMLRNGIVGVRDMGSKLDALQRFRAQAANEPLPDVIAAGPIVNGPAMPYSRALEVHLAKPEEAEAMVARLADGGAQFIKVYDGLDPATYAAVVAAAHRRALVVAGHLPFALDLDTAVEAGQRSIEHMYVHISKSCGQFAPADAANRWIEAYTKGGRNGGYSLEAREREELAQRAGRDAKRCREVLGRMAAKPVWWTPTLVLDFADTGFMDDDYRRFSTTYTAKDCETAAGYIKMLPADLRQHTLDAELEDVAMIHAAGVHLLAGTDMPRPCNAPVVSLWRELGLFVRAGLSPYDALKTATVEPAAYFGRADAGVLAPGKAADIVLLSANPLENIEAVRQAVLVVKAGRVVQTLARE